jgi:hypothetical protein
MPIVTTLSFVRAVKDKTRGVRVTLTYYNCSEYVSCEKLQEAPIHLTKERTTMHAYLQELRKRLQENHDNCAEALTKKAAADAASAAKKDAVEKTVEELKRQLQPKRARTDDDAANAHEMLAEVDDWDLRDHRHWQQATRVQNRRNVQVGSRKNQPNPRTGTDNFLHHTRLGLVGWISYWCLRDSALAVDILVALINSSVMLWSSVNRKK